MAHFFASDCSQCFKCFKISWIKIDPKFARSPGKRLTKQILVNQELSDDSTRGGVFLTASVVGKTSA